MAGLLFEALAAATASAARPTTARTCSYRVGVAVRDVECVGVLGRTYRVVTLIGTYTAR